MDVDFESDDVDPLLVDFTCGTLPADLRSVVSVESKVSFPLELCDSVVWVFSTAPSAVVPDPSISAPALPDDFVVPDWLLDIEASEWLLPSASVQSCCEELLLLRASVVSLVLPPQDSPDWVTPGVLVGWAFSLWVWLDSAWLVNVPFRDCDIVESDPVGLPSRVEEEDELDEEPVPLSVSELDDDQVSAAVGEASPPGEDFPESSGIGGVPLEELEELLDDQVSSSRSLDDCDDDPVATPLASVEELLEAERLDGPEPLLVDFDSEWLVPVVGVLFLPTE